MSDFNSSLPTRTENDGDVVVKVADGTTPSQHLAVDSSGRVVVKLDDGSGNLVSSQANGAQQALDVGVNVAGVQVDPRSIRALTSSDVVTADQGTAAGIAGGWTVKPTDGTNSQAYTAAGEAKVDITQPLPAGTNAIGTVKAQLQDNAGTAVVLGQTTMSASLPVVFASNQSHIPVELQDGAGTAITSQVNGSQHALDVGVNVAGVQIDPRSIRALTSSDVVQANIKDATGTAFSSTNPLPVFLTSSVPGTMVNKYNTTVALAVAGTANHDYAITSGKTLSARKFWASGSGRIRADVQTSPDGTTFTTYWTAFNSTSEPNISIDLDTLEIQDSGTGSKVRIVITNDDKSSFDIFSTISGTEQ